MHETALPRFVFLYGALFAGFGVASPFLPGLLAERGLNASAIGLVLGLGSAIRLVSGPLGGRLADRPGAARPVLVAGLAASAVVALGYAPARGLLPLALVVIAHATLLAPLTPIADALALGTGQRQGFDYGWVRGTGSAAFIVGSALAGQAVGWTGLGVVIWLNAGLLAAAALFAARVPNRPPAPPAAHQARDGQGRANQRDGRARANPRDGRVRDLLLLPVFVRLMVVAALVGGSHALHDGFEVIRWRAAGMGPGAAGLLWGESVAAEMLVFFLLGRPLIDRLGISGAAMLSAASGIVRWGAAAQTAALPVMASVEPLHGFTFALLHLVCMRTIAQVVPERLAATAQAFYGTVAVGAATTAMTLISGTLYDRVGAASFWSMAALCAAALPVAYRLRDQVAEPGKEAAQP